MAVAFSACVQTSRSQEKGQSSSKPSIMQSLQLFDRVLDGGRPWRGCQGLRPSHSRRHNAQQSLGCALANKYPRNDPDYPLRVVGKSQQRPQGPQNPPIRLPQCRHGVHWRGPPDNDKHRGTQHIEKREEKVLVVRLLQGPGLLLRPAQFHLLHVELLLRPGRVLERVGILAELGVRRPQLLHWGPASTSGRTSCRLRENTRPSVRRAAHSHSLRRRTCLGDLQDVLHRGRAGGRRPGRHEHGSERLARKDDDKRGHGHHLRLCVRAQDTPISIPVGVSPAAIGLSVFRYRPAPCPSWVTGKEGGAAAGPTIFMVVVAQKQKYKRLDRGKHCALEMQKKKLPGERKRTLRPPRMSPPWAAVASYFWKPPPPIYS